jgi:predicted porin
VNILNKLKSSSACVCLCLAGSLFWCRAATAEVTLFEKDDWTFSFDGRVNSFLSVGKGDDLPLPTPDPTGGHHTVMGADSPNPGQGVGDVGWRSNGEQDVNNKYFAARIRSGLFGNVLAFALTKKISEVTTVRAYVSIWSTIETLGRDKWFPVTAEAREGYFTASSTWGSVTAGRSLGWLGRTSYETDVMYGHGYGLGLPCSDSLGPACGHIGTGALLPGYSAGVSYSTPSFYGLQIHVGAYDPIVFNPGSPSDWSHATFVRPEGAVTYESQVAQAVKLKLGVEGLYQQIGRNGTDPTTMAPINVKSSVWGASGGARLELGPARLGFSGFRGRGIGLGTALQNSVATEAGAPSYKLRTFTGFYGQLAYMAGPLHIAAGYGQGIVDQLDVDKANPSLSVIHTQTGISAAVYYHLSDSVILGLDWFHFIASWYGAPLVDATTMLPTGGKLAGEKQTLDFVNVGVTFRW